MSKLSDGLIIRGKNIKNRIVMPPMMCFSFKGDNGGMYGKQYVDHYTARAKGGTGLIIIQSTDVMGATKQAGVWSDGQMKPLQSIAENCHHYDSTVMIQLAFGSMDINDLSVTQLHDLQDDSVAAAKRSKDAGFDGVEFHFAHGFTLCKFLDPTHNKRTDNYGGTVENRVRFITEIIHQLREVTSENFIISARMGSNIPDVEGAIAVAKVLEKNGIDLLNISFGMEEPKNEVLADFKGNNIVYNGSKIKKNVNIPVIVVSEIFTGEQAQYLVEDGYADFVAIGRGMFTDENWANKVFAGEPINQCRNCGGNMRKCMWFFDHTKCPARKAVKPLIVRKKALK
jgi:2,4-dienoyl-CoA reductase-like NADH-dependent reductase (Old Yellow Enzyme family)